MPKKTFVNGNVLTDTDLNTFLMNQTVMTFADSTARASAIPDPNQGMVTYLEDTSVLQVYGTAWADVVPPPVVPTLTSSTATTYEVQSSDAGNYLQFTDAATLTVSTATAFAAGDQVQILADGTALSITGGTGVTLGGAGTAGTALTFTVGAQYEAVAIISVGSDSYRIIGNVTGA